MSVRPRRIAINLASQGTFQQVVIGSGYQTSEVGRSLRQCRPVNRGKVIYNKLGYEDVSQLQFIVIEKWWLWRWTTPRARFPSRLPSRGRRDGASSSITFTHRQASSMPIKLRLLLSEQPWGPLCKSASTSGQRSLNCLPGRLTTLPSTRS
jgi:hypothetical protein